MPNAFLFGEVSLDTGAENDLTIILDLTSNLNEGDNLRLTVPVSNRDILVDTPADTAMIYNLAEIDSVG